MCIEHKCMTNVNALVENNATSLHNWGRLMVMSASQDRCSRGQQVPLGTEGWMEGRCVGGGIQWRCPRHTRALLNWPPKSCQAISRQ